ncbi:MAG: hypothetical protein HY370_07425 [Proteobacteria bacterium]|nr:hypothetical protein [Pseudomonadota bacterium]
MLEKLGYGMHGVNTPPASGGSPYLDGVIASACCDLDATITSSYPGTGQTLANLVAAPADGAAQAGYNFHLGESETATTDDPAFTGTAGNAAAYFAFDGGDNFRIKDFSAVPTLRKLQRTDNANKWWSAIAFRKGSTTSTSIWGSSWSGADLGLYLYAGASDAVLYQGNGVSTLDNVILTSLAPAAGTDYVFIVSADMTASSNNIRIWRNSRTKTSFSKSWTAVTADSDEAFRLFASSNNGNPAGRMPNNSRFYHFSCGNAFIDDAQAALIFDHLNARHGRTYA